MTSVSLAMLFALILAATNYVTSADTKGELIFSHVLFRHGDRTPITSYPTDPYGNVSNWPVPFGQLTPAGMQQEYALGKWLRERYGNVLLSEQYSANEIYIRSTDTDRTLESAEANLAGLYQPHGNQVWNADLLWRPIPVHTVSLDDDWLIGETVPACPVFYDIAESLFTTDEFLQLLDEHRDFIEYTSEMSGITIPLDFAGLGYIVLLRDTLFIEDLYNLTLVLQFFKLNYILGIVGRKELHSLAY